MPSGRIVATAVVYGVAVGCPVGRHSQVVRWFVALPGEMSRSRWSTAV
ncbi:MAG: hypothetical protein ACRDO8_08095 [Nocardioidaceae bacterium]